ncbi:uncharacterized protein LOC106070099 isoform X1 [Biomphalaria glabrata]|uniref:Uncharacterized protein LOC106070099 isoform X1 n=1 Tax=Biomphalaria glabrata TaxID=6526 RepID=A0A9W2Z1Z8_BIOGL|nr:uncharacterized protein LOC106070099 isoform X1 [Biomphalaria glabrata]
MASYCCKSNLITYLQSYFVTIATILGTGILGLPVKLAHSGFYPFLISFIVDAFAQSLLVHCFTDLLQRAVACQYQRGLGEESVPLNTIIEEDIFLESDEDDGQTNVQFTGAIMKGKMQHIREVPLVQPPNLHLLAKLFLGCGLEQVFDLLVILHFVALLICYALAGSEAFAQLIGVRHIYVIPVFVWVLTASVLFAVGLIQPVVSILTLFKGLLLLGTTTITFYVGVSVSEKTTNDFSYVGAPFLMGSVALGGVFNTMPYTFEKVPYKRKQIFLYRLSVQLGLWTCVIFNIFWCWAVLDIVPQTIESACSSLSYGLAFYSNNSARETSITCHGELSLESAAVNGEISTIPLTKLLQRDHPQFTWVAILIQVFIAISITVSYLTIGTALHHTVGGIVQFMSPSRAGTTLSKAKSKKKLSQEWLIKTGLSLVAFVIVFLVAMLDPQGFVDILEKFVSFTMNVEVGIFVFLMLLFSHHGSFKHLDLPLPLSKCLYYFIFLLPLFFNFAVVYDVYCTIRDIVHPPKLLAGFLNQTVHGVNSSQEQTQSGQIQLMPLTSTIN